MSLGMLLPKISGLSVVKGGSLDLFSKSKVLVLEFWATWCGPCRQTIPHLTQLQKKYEPKVQFVGISNEPQMKVERFIKQMGNQMDYTVALDTEEEANGKLMGAFGAQGIPHAFIVDTDCKIQYSGHPLQPDFEVALQKAINNMKKPEPLPLIMASAEELAQWSIKDLKTAISDRGLKCTSCLEKDDLVKFIRENCSTTVYYKH
eukprot:GCRY01000581.1.p1 GENE.GCRY01000581.1~~GCRY01000581.1.p1  ORF type:complete len:204 (+),score=8.96 GCRY01000581.1:145-756(+)